VRDAIAAQADRWPLWTPVAFGGGCAVYFGLRSEPQGWWLYAAAAVAVALMVWARRSGRRALIIAATLLACLASGLAVAKLRTARVTAPIAPADTRPVTVEGWVVDVVSPGSSGARLVIAPVRIGGLAPEATPERVRVTLRGEAPAPGSSVRVRAILNPPPPPAAPGAYDFARDAFFRGIGGVGFALGEPRWTDLPRAPWRLQLTMWVNEGRWALASRIVDRLGPESGGIAAAMVTGHEAWIGQETLDAMRDSGLAHILSISGLHMAIVGGFVFFAVRLGVAAWPWLALRVPGKKVAAVAGLVAVGVYLVVSGAPSPAERAAVTAAVAFGAILLNRRAISLNALAVAAFAVLLTRPESVVQPGFQMSFAATAALVALAEVWPRRISEISAPWWILLIQRGRDWLFLAVATSFVAGLATGPFAMQHFNRTAVYGLLANLVVAPLSSFVIMPFLALGAALETAGLGGPFLAVAGWGVEAMTAVARLVSGLPGGVRVVAAAPAAALPVAFIGLLWLCLWKGKGRWLGLPFAAAVMLWPRPEPPDVWIAADGAAAAVRDGGQAVALRPDSKLFAIEFWRRRRGLAEPADPAAAVKARWTCDRSSCAPLTPGPGEIAAWWGRKAPKPEKLDALCRSAGLVVVRARVDAVPAACRQALLLDGEDFARGGSLELWRRDGRWLGRWSAELRGERPWTAVSGSGG